MHVTAIIAAGGSGLRVGGAVPKQFLEVDGRTILERSVEAFVSHPEIADVIVALPEEMAARPPDWLPGPSKAFRIVAGGARRQDSVMNAFRAVSDVSDVIVIHDAARPFVTADLISRTIAGAAETGAALAALPARDTVKRAERGASDAAGFFVAETLARESVFLAQTPQAFRREVLREALERGARDGAAATDEAALAERTGCRIQVIEGEPTNIKITTPEDLPIANAIARGGRPARTGRAGIGYDLHKLVEGRPFVLGGVTIPFDRGPMGHSDGDAVCHAITDAVLGAVADGDIGRHFPDTEERWRNASSLALLGHVVEGIQAKGFEVGNVDATVILERPKLAPYIGQMRATLAGVLDIAADRVSIKGKTNEGVGALGRGEAVAVHAIALLRSR